MLRIELLTESRDELGEGPLWDVAEQRLYWIDSHGRAVHRVDARGGQRRSWLRTAICPGGCFRQTPKRSMTACGCYCSATRRCSTASRPFWHHAEQEHKRRRACCVRLIPKRTLF